MNPIHNPDNFYRSRKSDHEESVECEDEQDRLQKEVDLDYVFHVMSGSLIHEMLTPKTFKKALNGVDAGKWMQSMRAELKSLQEHGVFEISNLPPGKKNTLVRTTL